MRQRSSIFLNERCAMLKIKNLNKSIQGKKIVDNLSLSVARGEIAVLLGASGVGKSTLLRVLNNLETIDSGQVILDDQALDLSTVHATHTIGIVFQHFNLFEHLSVERNITLALERVSHKKPEEAVEIARQLLERYGLADKRQCAVSQLSGGQKQRLALARTLALKPTVVCLDEPTSALDPLLTNSVANTIKELAVQGYMVLVATHDMSLVAKLPCMIHLMSHGSIIESIAATEFFANQGKYPRIAAFVAGSHE